MKYLLAIIGGFWGLIGLGNIIGMPWATATSNFLAFGLIFNGALFIFPALILLYMASSLSTKQKKLKEGEQ